MRVCILDAIHLVHREMRGEKCFVESADLVFLQLVLVCTLYMSRKEKKTWKCRSASRSRLSLLSYDEDTLTQCVASDVQTMRKRKPHVRLLSNGQREKKLIRPKPACGMCTKMKNSFSNASRLPCNTNGRRSKPIDDTSAANSWIPLQIWRHEEHTFGDIFSFFVEQRSY